MITQERTLGLRSDSAQATTYGEKREARGYPSCSPAFRCAGPTLGPTETRLLNRLIAGQVVFSTEQARVALGNGDQDVNKLLHHLARKRWLLRLEKGKYFILPLEAGMEGLYSAHEFVIAAHLVQPYAPALSSHALSDLLPHAVLLVTTRRKAEVTIEALGLHFRFITLSPHKFLGIQTMTIEDQPVQITTPPKTLVDGLIR